MPVFQRRPIAPAVAGSRYDRFRPFVREDFMECCAYCLLHEILASGPEGFELDHFRPRSLFPELINNFFNLYYACGPCNRRKGNFWLDEASGSSLVDFCAESFSAHLYENTDGSWVPLTDAGIYLADRLALNRRHLIELRVWLRGLAALQGVMPINWDQPSKDQIARLLTLGA